MKEGKKNNRVSWIIGGGIIFILTITAVWTVYSWIYRPALVNLDEDPAYLYIPTGSDYDDLYSQFEELNWHKNLKAFNWIAQKKNLPANIHPGRYEVGFQMSNDSLINLLRSGKQSEVNLTFTTKRRLSELAGVISHQIEVDSVTLLEVLRDTTIMDSLGFEKNDWFALFIPNTYRFFWNTDARGFVNRMHREYLNFWKGSRREKVKTMGLTVEELMTLASIIQDETASVADMPKIAGVYMNRLNKGIKLQSCPTVIYAWGEPRIRRLLNKHLKIDSDYNTYKHRGLPPGPIRIASVQAIDACLNYERHDYLYFSAKEDFSGATVYAKTYLQHLRNAKKYQRALNEREIY